MTDADLFALLCHMQGRVELALKVQTNTSATIAQVVEMLDLSMQEFQIEAHRRKVQEARMRCGLERLAQHCRMLEARLEALEGKS